MVREQNVYLKNASFIIIIIIIIIIRRRRRRRRRRRKRRKDNAHCGGRMKSLFEKTSSKEGIFLLYRSHYRAVDIWKDILLIKKVLYKKIKLIKFFYRDVFR